MSGILKRIKRTSTKGQTIYLLINLYKYHDILKPVEMLRHSTGFIKVLILQFLERLDNEVDIQDT